MKKILSLILFLSNLNYIAQAQNDLSKVYLNHVTIAVDDVTFKGIVKSSFMTKKFANIDAGLPKSSLPVDTSAVLYLRGKNTYIEIRNAKYSGDKEGQACISFSLEQAKEAKQLYDSLKLTNSSAFFSFDSSNVKRSVLLKKKYNADKLLNDISEINLQLSQKEALSFVEMLKQIKFNVSEKNNTYTIKGNDVLIRLKITDTSTPKLQLKLKLNMSKEGNYNLNNSKMEFDGNYGSWNFY